MVLFKFVCYGRKKCTILFISIETRPFSTPQIVRNLLMKGYVLSFIFLKIHQDTPWRAQSFLKWSIFHFQDWLALKFRFREENNDNFGSNTPFHSKKRTLKGKFLLFVNNKWTSTYIVFLPQMTMWSALYNKCHSSSYTHIHPSPFSMVSSLSNIHKHMHIDGLFGGNRFSNLQGSVISVFIILTHELLSNAKRLY